MYEWLCLDTTFPGRLSATRLCCAFIWISLVEAWWTFLHTLFTWITDCLSTYIYNTYEANDLAGVLSGYLHFCWWIYLLVNISEYTMLVNIQCWWIYTATNPRYICSSGGLFIIDTYIVCSLSYEANLPTGTGPSSLCGMCKARWIILNILSNCLLHETVRNSTIRPFPNRGNCIIVNKEDSSTTCPFDYFDSPFPLG